MPAESTRRIFNQAVLAEHTVRIEKYIVHTQETIALRRKKWDRCDSPTAMGDESDELMGIMLKVLAKFEEHHRILLDLQQRKAVLESQESAKSAADCRTVS